MTQPASELDAWKDLPPTQALALEVLAARARLGEPAWTFSARHAPALEGLAERGLVWWKHWTLPKTCLAWLTDEGRKVVLDVKYKPPAIKLLEEALLLRMYGERAPGGNETWRKWDDKAERFLRSLLPLEADPVPEVASDCPGFKWIGQSFATCDGCGKPAWEHEGEMRLRKGAKLVSAGSEGDWELRPWKPGEAEAIKRKWGPR
jgi:hypothetical protein